MPIIKVIERRTLIETKTEPIIKDKRSATAVDNKRISGHASVDTSKCESKKILPKSFPVKASKAETSAVEKNESQVYLQQIFAIS